MFTSKKARATTMATAMLAVAACDSQAAVSAVAEYDNVTDTTTLTTTFSGTYTPDPAQASKAGTVPATLEWSVASVLVPGVDPGYFGTATISSPALVGNSATSGEITFGAPNDYLRIEFASDDAITGGSVVFTFAGEFIPQAFSFDNPLTTGTFTGASSNLTITAVPEPSSSLLLVGGLAGLVLRRKRK